MGVARRASAPADVARPTTRRPATEEEARALASVVRMRILRVCLGQACTNNEIAAALERNPATTLHHVRRLVDTGFLVAQPVRRGTRGSREIPYITTGKSWVVNSPIRDHVLLDASLEEIAKLPPEALNVCRLGLRLPAEQMDEFETRMQALIDGYAALPDDPSAVPMSFLMVIHPDVTRGARGRPELT
jgi:hypothetical protein